MTLQPTSEQLNAWFSPQQQQPIIEQLSQRVGLTRTRATYFVKLWVYLLEKEHLEKERLNPLISVKRNSLSQQQPLKELTRLSAPVSCSHGEAASSNKCFDGIATPGDTDCTAVFIRSWMIDPRYLDQHRALFLSDVQNTLRKMQQDFPNLCDLHTLIIHPNYEAMAIALGFQPIGHQTSRDTQLYWMYQALDRYLALDIAAIFG